MIGMLCMMFLPQSLLVIPCGVKYKQDAPLSVSSLKAQFTLMDQNRGMVLKLTWNGEVVADEIFLDDGEIILV